MPSGRSTGIFACALMDRFLLLPAEDDGRLYDAGLRENFIERVFANARWRSFLKSGARLRDRVDFHSRHKYLLMAHSPAHLRSLGKVVAGAKSQIIP